MVFTDGPVSQGLRNWFLRFQEKCTTASLDSAAGYIQEVTAQGRDNQPRTCPERNRCIQECRRLPLAAFCVAKKTLVSPAKFLRRRIAVGIPNILGRSISVFDNNFSSLRGSAAHLQPSATFFGARRRILHAPQAIYRVGRRISEVGNRRSEVRGGISSLGNRSLRTARPPLHAPRTNFHAPRLNFRGRQTGFRGQQSAIRGPGRDFIGRQMVLRATRPPLHRPRPKFHAHRSNFIAPQTIFRGRQPRFGASRRVFVQSARQSRRALPDISWFPGFLIHSASFGATGNASPARTRALPNISSFPGFLIDSALRGGPAQMKASCPHRRRMPSSEFPTSAPM